MGCAQMTAMKATGHYMEGTLCLQSGDYHEAIAHLQEAVCLEPFSARNHLNLSSAYLAIGEVHLAFFHSRKAVLLGTDPLALYNFYQIYQLFEKKYHLNDLGQSEEKIRRVLGEPDKSEENQLTYGPLTFLFENQKLVSVKGLKPLKD